MGLAGSILKRFSLVSLEVGGLCGQIKNAALRAALFSANRQSSQGVDFLLN